MMFKIFYLALFVFGSRAFLLSGPSWDGLKATWGPNPFSSSYFVHQPRTIQDALDQGFVQLSDCSYNGNFTGIRYIRKTDKDSGDYALMLLFDIKGYIAGIQTAVTTNSGNYPGVGIQPPFVQDGNKFVLTAYFTDPATICSTGRDSGSYERDGTGDSLHIQNGHSFNQVMTIPMQESALTSTKWVQGKCFYTMGNHYWYDLHQDMSCDAMFPVFLLYNGGELNAFGWAMVADLKSSHLEHPDKSTFSLFMKTVPSCLLDGRIISTMHIYLTSSAATDLC